LVVIAILGLLVALLLPAIQASRESARRSSCVNNLRQLALAFHGHLDTKGAFPHARVNLPGLQHGWVVELLPYFEEQAIADQYRMNKDFFAVENEPAITIPIPVTTCPSTPLRPAERVHALTAAGGMPYGTNGAAADYSVAYLLNAISAVATGTRYASDDLATALYAGPREDNLPHPVTRITDGMSHTALVLEQAGRPDHYIAGAKQASNSGLQFAAWWMAWASHRVFTYQGYDADGKTVGAACAVNCNNSQGIYSFHPTGTCVAYCDGSVRFTSDDISVRLTYALLTRAGEETFVDELSNSTSCLGGFPLSQ
jgi:type II secretory pathway pseudopilin PulG